MTTADLISTPILLILLAYISWIDIRSFRLPDRLTLPLIAAGLALAILRDHTLPAAELLGCIAGFTVFAALGEGFFRLRGVDGLGLGDAKLLAAAGAWLGWPALPWLVLLSAVPALIVALVRPGRGGVRIAFGPWLAAAFAATWLLRLAGVALPGS